MSTVFQSSKPCTWPQLVASLRHFPVNTDEVAAESPGRSEAKLADLVRRLGDAGIERCSPRAHLAIMLFKDGVDAEQCVRYAALCERQSRELWCEKALDPFCKKHGLTRRQAISVIFDDVGSSSTDPEERVVTVQDLYWNGQGYDFSRAMLKQMDAADVQTGA
jgi:hypothetical protein